ncbi:MAG TPA: hypothetical protein VM618_12025 [Acidimicrobiia bacterium]|nr:hypothetical protein [Acidimicrobiia bacterium]
MRIPGIEKLRERRERREAVDEMSGRPPAGPLLKGYGPLAAFAILFVMMAGLVPTVDQQTNSTGFVAGTDDPTAGGGFTPDTFDAGGAGGKGGGSGNGGGGTTGNGTGPVSSVRDDGGEKVAAQPGRGQGSCAGKEKQVPADPYSPPCVEWAGGSNGGETHRGVNATTVKISFRASNEKGFLQTLATLAGADIVDTPTDIKRTVDALVEFFNEQYQFYGRKLEVQYYTGDGSLTAELLGHGRGEARADAQKAAQEIKPFVEMNAASEPFAGALAELGVIGFGTPYLSRAWHNERAPYAWSVATDCSIVAEVAAELAVKTLAGKKASFAGEALQDRERRLAGVSPENEWYQVCHDDAVRVISDAGFDPGIKQNYKLDINSMSNQAAGMVAKLKDENVTTVLCGCDPIYPVFLSAKATEQNYFPEWVVLGTALTDWDVAAQLYDQSQWANAFGVSSLGEPVPIRAGLGYSAYKSIRGDEPAFAVELIYGTLLLISTGIQMAGPDLNPNTFAQGLKSWPGGTGPYGTWGFGPPDYTPTRDYRIIYWNSQKISIVNNQQGAYETAYNAQRFPPGNLPSGELQVSPQ